MRHSRWSFSCTLLALLVFVACGSDDKPTAPLTRLSTEVTVETSTVTQGERANAVARFSATTGEDVEISFSHSAPLGYRVTSADGVLIMEFPSQVFGSPSDFVVRPGWDLQININVPTTRPLTAYEFVNWLSEEEVLPEGEYILEAGLYDMEKQFRWGKASFTVLSAEENR